MNVQREDTTSNSVTTAAATTKAMRRTLLEVGYGDDDVFGSHCRKKLALPWTPEWFGVPCTPVPGHNRRGGTKRHRKKRHDNKNNNNKNNQTNAALVGQVDVVDGSDEKDSLLHSLTPVLQLRPQNGTFLCGDETREGIVLSCCGSFHADNNKDTIMNDAAVVVADDKTVARSLNFREGASPHSQFITLTNPPLPNIYKGASALSQVVTLSNPLLPSHSRNRAPVCAAPSRKRAATTCVGRRETDDDLPIGALLERRNSKNIHNPETELRRAAAPTHNFVTAHSPALPFVLVERDICDKENSNTSASSLEDFVTRIHNSFANASIYQHTQRLDAIILGCLASKE